MSHSHLMQYWILTFLYLLYSQVFGNTKEGNVLNMNSLPIVTVFGPMTEARPVEKAKATGAGASSSRLPSPPDHAPPAVPVPAVPPPPPPHRPKPEGLTPKTAPPSKPPGLRLESSDVPTSSSVPSASNPLAAVEAALGDLDPVVSLVVCLDSGLGGRTKSINPEPKEY